ncbi:hypothetical protein GCM10009665_54620 [Kitasatospora nipponensis]|uniref:Uncharacterized protein n=1 Tax=Kitasatospora nipponensis TaxID=258049 RepID=A0ABP4HDA6_9ACTN
MAGVITASEPSWTSPFTGLSPRDFSKLMTVLRRQGADTVRPGRPWSLPGQPLADNRPVGGSEAGAERRTGIEALPRRGKGGDPDPRSQATDTPTRAPADKQPTPTRPHNGRTGPPWPPQWGGDHTARTDPAADTGNRISVVHRYHEQMSSVFVTWIIAGP